MRTAKILAPFTYWLLLFVRSQECIVAFHFFWFLWTQNLSDVISCSIGRMRAWGTCESQHYPHLPTSRVESLARLFSPCITPCIAYCWENVSCSRETVILRVTARILSLLFTLFCFVFCSHLKEFEVRSSASAVTFHCKDSHNVTYNG